MDERVRVRPKNEYSVEATETGLPLPKHEFNEVGTIVGSIPPEKKGLPVIRYLVRFGKESQLLHSFKPEDLIFEEPQKRTYP